MLKPVIVLAGSLFAVSAVAQTEIVGTVDSKCIVISETPGIYGNPSPNLLTTNPSNGGVKPIIRYDVISAEYYKARITYPEAFSTAPTLDDVVNWDGGVTVAEVSSTDMSAYDDNKVTYNNVTEYELTVAGSTWFTISSEADYGSNKSLPAGTYNAVVEAECIPL